MFFILLLISVQSRYHFQREEYTAAPILISPPAPNLNERIYYYSIEVRTDPIIEDYR